MQEVLKSMNAFSLKDVDLEINVEENKEILTDN